MTIIARIVDTKTGQIWSSSKSLHKQKVQTHQNPKSILYETGYRLKTYRAAGKNQWKWKDLQLIQVETLVDSSIL